MERFCVPMLFIVAVISCVGALERGDDVLLSQTRFPLRVIPQSVADQNLWHALDPPKLLCPNRLMCTGKRGELCNLLVTASFNFDIPEYATVAKVEAEITRMSGVGPESPRDSVVKLVKNGAMTGRNMAAYEFWSLHPPPQWTLTYSTGDTWGVSLTPRDVNSDHFGIGLQVGFSYGRNQEEGAIYTALVQCVSVKVSYYLDCSLRSQCNLNGVCIANNTCECLPPYGGPDCSQIVCSDRQFCNNHGDCTKNGCECDTAWKGQFCEQRSQDVNAIVGTLMVVMAMSVGGGIVLAVAVQSYGLHERFLTKAAPQGKLVEELYISPPPIAPTASWQQVSSSRDWRRQTM